MQQDSWKDMQQDSRTSLLLPHSNSLHSATQKQKFSIKDLFSKCGQIRRKLWIWSHLLKKSFMGNFIFWVVWTSAQPIHLTFSVFYYSLLARVRCRLISQIGYLSYYRLSSIPNQKPWVHKLKTFHWHGLVVTTKNILGVNII